MNFFKLYIGDYQRDTAHLSVVEHGAYLLMLQHFYATEKPLPRGQALHRMLRAQTKAERDAIDSVAAQFWTTTEAGLVNDRANEEITKAAAQADTNRAVAVAREAARKAARKEHDSCSDRSTIDQPNHSQTPDTRENLNPSGLRPVSSPSGDGPVAMVNGSIPACPIDAVINAYHVALPAAPRVAVRNVKRDKLISGRWRQVFADGKAHDRDEGLRIFEEFFAFCGESKFLTGRTNSRDKDRAPFVVDLEWLMSPTNFAKTIEGRYHR